MTDETATVPYIESEIRQMWGDDCSLCGADGLHFEDSAATRGECMPVPKSTGAGQPDFTHCI